MIIPTRVVQAVRVAIRERNEGGERGETGERGRMTKKIKKRGCTTVDVKMGNSFTQHKKTGRVREA